MQKNALGPYRTTGEVVGDLIDRFTVRRAGFYEGARRYHVVDDCGRDFVVVMRTGDSFACLVCSRSGEVDPSLIDPYETAVRRFEAQKTLEAVWDGVHDECI